jgi:DNA polymerase-3 subunit beta
LKFTCNKDVLAKAAQIVHRGTKDIELPIMSGILLRTEGEQLILASTDTEEGIECRVPIQCETEGGAILDGYYFTEIIRKMAGPNILIEQNQQDHTVRVMSGESFFDLVYIDEEEFPQFPQVDVNSTFTVPQALLRKMIAKIIPSLADNDTRYLLMGGLIEGRDGNLKLVGTDSHRLAIASKEGAYLEELPSFSIILHKKMLAEVAGVLNQDEKSTVEVAMGTNHVVFKLPGVTIIARKMEGEYPQYEAVVPQEFSTTLLVDRQQLLAAVDRLSLLGVGKESTPLIRFHIGDQQLLLTSRDQTKGQGEDRLSCEKEGENLELSFNGKFLLDGLRALEGEEVKIKFSGPMSAALLTDPESDEFKYVLMPTFD